MKSEKTPPSDASTNLPAMAPSAGSTSDGALIKKYDRSIADKKYYNLNKDKAREKWMRWYKKHKKENMKKSIQKAKKWKINNKSKCKCHDIVKNSCKKWQYNKKRKMFFM